MDLTWLIVALVLLIVLFVGLGLAAMLTSTGAKRWAWGAGVTAPFMVYALPVAGIFISLNLLSGLAAVKGLSAVPLWRRWWFRFAALTAVIPFLAMAWSPQPVAGFRDFVYTLPYFFLVGALYQFDDDNGNAARKLLAWALVLCNIEAVLVIIFRVSPPIEAAFISSRLAAIFISPNVLYGLFTNAPNNIFDVGKAGGFFVNANVASAFLGCAAMLAWGLGREQRWRVVSATAVFCWIAVFFTGSKAGAACGVFVPLAIFIVNAIRQRKVELSAVIFGCFVAAALVALSPLILSAYQDTGYTRASTETLSVRRQIWAFAWQMFKQHPILGLGNGGWEEKYPIYAMSQGISPGFPAHNFMLILWSKGGLFAALSGLAYVVTFLRWSGRQALQGEKLATLATGLTAAFFWTTVQAAGENFGLLGEPHMTTLLAIAIGIVARESVARGDLAS